jgi:hypothetical protein
MEYLTVQGRSSYPWNHLIDLQNDFSKVRVPATTSIGIIICGFKWSCLNNVNGQSKEQPYLLNPGR